MADNSFRILLDLNELNLKSFKFVWMSISPRDLRTIKDLKVAILKKFSFDQVDIHLFLQDGLLPEDENLVVLRENDVIRIQYAALLNPACDDSSVTNTCTPGSVPHGSEDIESKKEKCSKKRKKKSHVSSPSIIGENNGPEKRVESNKKKEKKRRHLSFETLTENNATSRNSDVINPVDENVRMKDIDCADSSELTNDNWYNCKRKKKRKCSHSNNQGNSFKTNENEIIFSDELITILDDESSSKFIESNQTKEQEVRKKDFSKTLENCKSSEAVPCSVSTSISNKNFTECENTNIPTIDLEINVKKKPTKHDEKNKTATFNSEGIVTNTLSPMLGNNCKKRKKKRNRKRKPMLTDSPFSEPASFNSDSTVAKKSKNLDDSLHISRSNSSAVKNKVSFSVPSVNLHVGTASKPSHTKTSCETKNTSPSGRENNFSWLGSIQSPMQTEHLYARHNLETANKLSPSKSSCVTKNKSPVNVYEDNSSTFRSMNSLIKTDYSHVSHLETSDKPSPGKNSCVTKNSSSVNVYEDNSSTFRSINFPIKTDYSSESRHLDDASINIHVNTSTPIQQTDYSNRSRHLETTSKPSSRESSCMITKTPPTTVFENNSSSYRCNKKIQIEPDYINVKWETTSTKVLHSAPLNSFPAAGTRIAYKILELDETYSPVVSDYKEGIVTKVFPETDELDIELIKPEVKFGRMGKFENIYDEDEPPPTEVINTVHLKWSSLIDPIRRLV